MKNKFKLPNDEFKRLSFDLALRLAELDGVKIRLEALLLLVIVVVVEDICLWNRLVMLGDEDGEDEHILEFKIRFTPFVLLLLEEEDAAEIHANGCVEFVVDDDEFPILFLK